MSDEPNFKIMLAARDEYVKELKELRIMQLSAISVASIQNTKESLKERINKDNPYWTVAYADVCKAIDREMAERHEKDKYKALLKEAEEALAFALFNFDKALNGSAEVLEKMTVEDSEKYRMAKQVLKKIRGAK